MLIPLKLYVVLKKLKDVKRLQTKKLTDSRHRNQNAHLSFLLMWAKSKGLLKLKTCRTILYHIHVMRTSISFIRLLNANSPSLSITLAKKLRKNKPKVFFFFILRVEYNCHSKFVVIIFYLNVNTYLQY